MQRLLVVCFVFILIVPAAADGQVFGQYTTAAISEEVEGCLFIATGDDAFRAGAAMRFSINRRSDLGFQLGFDRFRGANSAGAGVDLKLYLINPDSPIPIDLALDGHLGHLRSDDYNRNLFGISLITSGVLRLSTSFTIEPFGAVMLRSTYFTKKGARLEDAPSGWPTTDDDWSSVTDTIVRAGVMLGLTENFRIHVELELNDETTVGAGLISVF